MATATKLSAPMPLAGPNQPVDWMFAYKFNDGSFPGWDNGEVPPFGTPGIFGGTVDQYPEGLSQQYVFATSKSPTLVKGKGPIGATTTDPLGATFAQVFFTPGYYYVLWNDQFYDNPIESKSGSAGHSKGMAAWNDDGEGFVLQVSTPSWPASGCHTFSRNSQKTIDAVKNKQKDSKGKLIELDYNTLGCIDDDDVEVAQHFFCLKLTKDDLVNVLKGLINASVVTDPTKPPLCNNGGPSDVQSLVKQMGKASASKTVFTATLSSGVQLIAKPSSMAVPPWQMISAQLNSLSLRVVSWWANPNIYSTKAGEVPGCWAPGLGTPGDVDIALTGSWAGVTVDLIGANGRNGNHAKIGISKDPSKTICIFGDENQQGALSATPTQACHSSQNGRGGTYYVVNNAGLFKSLTQLFAGRTAGADKATTDLRDIEEKQPVIGKPVGTKAPKITTKTSAKAKPAAKKKAAAKPKAVVKKKTKTAVKAKPKKAAAKKAVTKKAKTKTAVKPKVKKAAKKKA
jgi:Deoxyribonuclease II